MQQRARLTQDHEPQPHRGHTDHHEMSDRPAIDQDAGQGREQVGRHRQACLDEIDLRPGSAKNIFEGGGIEPHAPKHKAALNQLPRGGGRNHPPTRVDSL